MCPDNAITKLGPGKRFAIDYDYCKGCGICVAECPAGAIELVPEQR
jgi:2-oxoacid:acceptor oxidoreductase delta subunit (pyruvate/2-ketoisovalerate family)